jgi:hypothetical protein
MRRFMWVNFSDLRTALVTSLELNEMHQSQEQPYILSKQFQVLYM